MANFNYDFSNQTDLRFGLSGPDGYTPDVSLPAALKPRPLISNEREHANVLRLDTIEQAVLTARKQEEADRTAIKQDLNLVSEFFHDVINHDTQVGFIMNQLNQEMSLMEHNRTEDEVSLLNAINENTDAINEILSNQRALSAAERAELIVEQTINIARATAKGAEAAASGVGVIPVFGPVFSNGAKVVADTAEAVADTAAAIKESQILSTLVDSFHSMRSLYDHPTDMLTAAVNMSSSASELGASLKILSNRVRSMDSLNFQKVSVPGETMHSTAYVMSNQEYGQSVVYYIKPSSSTVHIHASISDRSVAFNLHESFGQRDVNGMGALIANFGVVDSNVNGARIVEFNTIISADRIQAMLMAMQRTRVILTVEERIGYFEQYIVRGIKPDNKTLLADTDSIFADLHSSAHNYAVSDRQSRNARHLIEARNKQRDTHDNTSGTHHVDSALDHRYAAAHIIKLTSKFRIGGYSVFEYYFGPLTHSGTYAVSAIGDAINATAMYVQIAGRSGQVVTLNVSGETAANRTINLTVGDDHSISHGGTNFQCDRLVFRIYMINPLSVTIAIGPTANSPITADDMIDHKNIDAHIDGGLDYDYTRRMIDPVNITSISFSYRPWDFFKGNGDWTNPR